MGLAGSLKDVSLPELLAVIALTEKSGKLTLTTGLREGLVVFRRGKIIYAASDTAREAFGNILVSLHLVDEPTLLRALERQHRSGEEKRLGAILVDMGSLSPDDLERVMQDQVRKVLGELGRWRRGFFRFRNLEIPDRGEVEVDARDLMLDSGLNADQAALELVSRADEHRAGEEAIDSDSGPRPAVSGGPSAQGDDTTLGAILQEVDVPFLTAEMVLYLLRASEPVFDRVVVLGVAAGVLAGITQRGTGLAEGKDLEEIRALRLTAVGESLAARAALAGATQLGHLEHTEENGALVAALGGAWPREAAAVPAAAGLEVFLVLYGDCMDHPVPLEGLAQVELAVRDVGLALARRRRGQTVEFSWPGV